MPRLDIEFDSKNGNDHTFRARGGPFSTILEPRAEVRFDGQLWDDPRVSNNHADRLKVKARRPHRPAGGFWGRLRRFWFRLFGWRAVGELTITVTNRGYDEHQNEVDVPPPHDGEIPTYDPDA